MVYVNDLSAIFCDSVVVSSSDNPTDLASGSIWETIPTRIGYWVDTLSGWLETLMAPHLDPATRDWIRFDDRKAYFIVTALYRQGNR